MTAERKETRRKLTDTMSFLESVVAKLERAADMTWVTETPTVNELSVAITRLREVKAEMEQQESEYDYLIKRAMTIETDIAIMKAHVEKVQIRLDDLETMVIDK